jgi:hypothetical protein
MEGSIVLNIYLNVSIPVLELMAQTGSLEREFRFLNLEFLRAWPAGGDPY